MRICILTQPLHTNYGGLLQAYALQAILKQMGHEVWTEDRKWKRPLIVNVKQLIARRKLSSLASYIFLLFVKLFFRFYNRSAC